MTFCYSCMSQLPDQKLITCPHCGEPLQPTVAVTDILLPGTILQGKFVVGKLLGSGGFGNTYIGWNQVLACRVAIKEFFPRSMSVRDKDRKTICISGETMEARYRQSLRSFLEEARRLAELNDVQEIPDIYSYFEENGTGYIVMEYLEGITVKKLIKDSGGRLSYEWSRQIILSVLYILKKIHRRGILHRDIAPDNIMITSDGIIKLIDFGVAKKQINEAADSILMLKAGYSPLEQYTRNAHQGVYTDLYSVAASFYHMVTGVKPPSAMERMNQDALQPLSAYGVNISQQAEIGTMMCLYLNPEHRLSSADEFIIALDGQNFKPVMKLKQSKEAGNEKKEEKRNREFPLIGKIASIVLLTAVAAMSIMLIMRQNKSEVAETSINVIRAQSVLGMTEAEAKEILESSGEDVIFEADKVFFEKGIEGGSEILTQEPAAGEDVAEGIITGTVRSSEKCMYIDVLELENNVDVLVEELGIDRSKLAASVEGDAADQKKSFKNLYEVILNDGTRLKPTDLEVGKDSRVLNLSEIQSVTYYVSPYIYKKKLGKYVGKNIKDISFDKYTEKNGERKKIKGGASPAYSARYFSFDKKEGYIVEQKKAKGKSYNSYKDMGELFVTVKEQIAYDKTDADGLIKKLRNKGFRVNEEGSGTEIADIRVSGKGGTVYFTKKDEITITRREKAVPKRIPKSKSVSKPKKPLGAAGNDMDLN